MNRTAILSLTLGLALAAPAASAAQSEDLPTITLYDQIGFEGRSITLDGDAPDLRWVQANDMASSIRINGGQWEVCLEPEFGGTCQVLDADQPNMSQWAFNDRITSVQAIHQPRRDNRRGVTLYEGRNYSGRSVNIVRETGDLSRSGFNDDANSIRIHSGTWTLCEHGSFSGRCVEIDRDSNDLKLFRMDDRLSALGPNGIPRPEPAPRSTAGRGDSFDRRSPGRIGGGDIRLMGGEFGIGVTFFREPIVEGFPVSACAERGGRRCRAAAADLTCQQAGFGRAAYHGVERIGRIEAYHAADRMFDDTHAILVDLLCEE